MIHWTQHQMSTAAMRGIANTLAQTISGVRASDGSMSEEDSAKSNAAAYLMSAAEYIEALEQSGDPRIVNICPVETHDITNGKGEVHPQLEIYGLDMLGKLWRYIQPDDVDDGREPGWYPMPSARGQPPAQARQQ